MQFQRLLKLPLIGGHRKNTSLKHFSGCCESELVVALPIEVMRRGIPERCGPRAPSGVAGSDRRSAIDGIVWQPPVSGPLPLLDAALP
jgi:hypothetical protein